MDKAIELAVKHSAPSLFVHSPPPEWIIALCRTSNRKQITIWFHGFEVRDYRRLAFNYSTKELELQRSILDSINAARFKALRELDKNSEIKTVFVSKYLLGIARGDSGAELATASVIPNYIDGNFFSARLKSPDMARRILLIRSFAARNYANDIALGALRLLSERPEFADFSITIRGVGRYFASLTSPLTGFANVDVKEAYLSSTEIKTLHDTHGLFLVPSRHDTQGVTMCEAMASGLVCVTNPVAAIPEFFDEGCGYLARPESIEAFAEAILTAVADGDGFTTKSRIAASRVRSQCGVEETIRRELALTNQPARSL